VDDKGAAARVLWESAHDREGTRNRGGGAKPHSRGPLAPLRSDHLAAIVAVDFRGATFMTTRAVTASSTNEPARTPAMTRTNDPTLLTQAELELAVGGGGPVGANPSRNGLRLMTERA
jgi:hypothetical protein